jgi:transposase
MATKRIEMHRLQELVRLHRMEVDCREVARMLQMGPNTERRYRLALQAEGLLQGSPEEVPEAEVLKAAVAKHLPAKSIEEKPSSVQKWAGEIEQMSRKEATPKAIYDCLRLGHEDFTGSLSAVKRFCRRLKKAAGIKAEEVAIPVESKPGEIAQVDFGYVGRIIDPEQHVLRKAWVFVMVLGFSRHRFDKIVFDQKVETWLKLHVEAFSKFGGVVETVVPDNLKSAVIRHAFGVDGPTSLNRSYWELARYYGFKVDPAPPRDPEKKGKVESGVKYVKRNFFRPRDFEDAAQAQSDLEQWGLKIAGLRTHGTTGRRPLDLFEQEERDALKPLPAKPYELVVWKKAQVHHDSHIQFDRRLYSVPWRHINQQVWVRASSGEVCIYLDDERIATHDRHGSSWRSTKDEHLPEHRVAYRHRSIGYWEERADKLGEQVGRYIREVFNSDDVLSRLRCVQGMVTYLEQHPRERANATCERASYFGNYTLRGLKNILRKALDFEPLPGRQAELGQIIIHPRFARKASEFLS